MPKVSVILPVFNAENYIRDSVESVLNQTFKDFSLYVIDDGSTDKSLQILHQINDHRLKIIRNEGNRGLIYTLNRGLEISRDYKYIARMDADDLCMKERLYKQVEFLDSNKEYILVGTGSIHFNNKIEKSEYNPEHDSSIKAGFLNKNTLSHPTVMMRNSIGDKLSYDSLFPKYEDLALWIKLMNEGKFYNIQSPLLKYRRHENNITNTYKKNPEFDFDVYKKLVELYISISNQHLSEEHILLLCAISNKTRSLLEPDLSLDFIFYNYTSLLKTLEFNEEGKKFFSIGLELNIIKYLIFNKRKKDLLKFISKSLYNNKINLFDIYKYQKYGSVI